MNIALSNPFAPFTAIAVFSLSIASASDMVLNLLSTTILGVSPSASAPPLYSVRPKTTIAGISALSSTVGILLASGTRTTSFVPSRQTSAGM